MLILWTNNLTVGTKFACFAEYIRYHKCKQFIKSKYSLSGSYSDWWTIIFEKRPYPFMKLQAHT